MSLLAYTGKHVIADRKSICQSSGYLNIQYSQKLHLSECQRFVFGSVGLLFPRDQLKLIERMMLERLVSIKTGSPCSPELREFIKRSCTSEDRQIVIVTKQFALILGHEEGDEYLNELHGYGTGANTFMAAYNVLGDVYKAYYVAEDLIPTVGMKDFAQPDVFEIAKLKDLLILDQERVALFESGLTK